MHAAIAEDFNITKISPNRMLERCTFCYQNYRKEVSSEPIKNPGNNHLKGEGNNKKLRESTSTILGNGRVDQVIVRQQKFVGKLVV